jgi:hypothetical protein
MFSGEEDTMAEFIVKQVAGSWCVINNSVIYATRATASEAIGQAISVATAAARHDRPKRVIYEASVGVRRIVWDSEKDLVWDSGTDRFCAE